MRPRTAARIGWSIVAFAVILSVAGLAMAVAGGWGGVNSPSALGMVAILCVTSSVVGALIVPREAANPIGWLFCGLGAFVAAALLLGGYAEVAPADATRGAGQLAAWVGNWAYVAIPPIAIFVPLLFPDGRLLTPRWRPVAWCGAVGTAAYGIGVACTPGPLGDYPWIENPCAIDGALATTLRLGGLTLVAIAFAAATVSVAVRYHRADDLRRQQIKLLAAAAGAVAASAVAGAILREFGETFLGGGLLLFGFLAIPLGVAVAMLRYRLYDVDRVISRSLTYAFVTVTLGAVYVGLVLAGQALFSEVAGGSNLAIAVSTLVVAALFLPVRRRGQGFVDRRFYRRRYDAQRTLEAFAARLREQVELDGLRTDLQGVVAQAMQPAHVSVWLRDEKP